jgi:transcriptional regulator with XRE-family HTH domain
MDSQSLNRRSIAVALAQKGLRHWQAAARAGISPSSLGDYVHGRRKAPVAVLRRLARALGVEPDALVTTTR